MLFELYFCPNDVIINVKSNRIYLRSLTSYFSQSLFYSCIKINSKDLFNLFIYRLHFAYPTTTNNEEKVSSLPIIEYLKILLNAEQSFNRFVTCSKQMLSCYYVTASTRRFMHILDTVSQSFKKIQLK